MLQLIVPGLIVSGSFLLQIQLTWDEASILFRQLIEKHYFLMLVKLKRINQMNAMYQPIESLLEINKIDTEIADNLDMIYDIIK